MEFLLGISLTINVLFFISLFIVIKLLKKKKEILDFKNMFVDDEENDFWKGNSVNE